MRLVGFVRLFALRALSTFVALVASGSLALVALLALGTLSTLVALFALGALSTLVALFALGTLTAPAPIATPVATWVASRWASRRATLTAQRAVKVARTLTGSGERHAVAPLTLAEAGAGGRVSPAWQSRDGSHCDNISFMKSDNVV